MQWLYPQFPASRLPRMLRIAMLGAAIAAAYGAVHDQVSFTISPEYFTKLKFHQFAWADLGWPPRLFASEVGVLATWWVGLIAGWLLARAGLVDLSPHEQRSKTCWAFGIVFVATLMGGLLGWALGAVIEACDLSSWTAWQRLLKIEDLRAFVVVAYLHYGGYLGALVGLIAAIFYVRRHLAIQRVSESGQQRSR